jgi:magnesium-transporting ATPase (P-type)
MSIIVKNQQGEVMLFCKGADEAILPKLSKASKSDQDTLKFVNEFSE